jgi:hypothetical protein
MMVVMLVVMLDVMLDVMLVAIMVVLLVWTIRQKKRGRGVVGDAWRLITTHDLTQKTTFPRHILLNCLNDKKPKENDD